MTTVADHWPVAFRLSASPFILLRQNKGIKQKATPESAPGASSRFPALLNLSGSLLNSLRSNRRKLFFQPDLRYSAQPNGEPKVKTALGFASLVLD
ncbi:hypothetical protein ACKF11_10605 [Methylobacillus sp. Pita2]|uniref:hypothetical protein n=1 Tax=Methylobacillus sp. Pita2 TaxID=3383245 RepID=UPI0038B690B2